MILSRIKMKDIVDNEFHSQFQISSYDYTVYTIVASISTINQGSLGISISYQGGDYAHMYVRQGINNMIYIYKYNFSAALFNKVVGKILHCHNKQLHYKCIYTGCTDIIGLINKVLQYGTQIIN